MSEVLVLHPEGWVASMPVPSLPEMYAVIECESVAVVSSQLSPWFDVWVGEDALVRDELELNAIATMVVGSGQTLFGRAIVTGLDDGNVAGLPDGLIERLELDSVAVERFSAASDLVDAWSARAE